MKTHLIGATWQDSDGGHLLVLASSGDPGYTTLLNVEDLTSAEHPSKIAVRDGLRLDYPSSEHGMKSIRCTTSDMKVHTFSVYLPTKQRALPNGDIVTNVVGQGRSFNSSIGLNSDLKGSWCTLLPALDPYNVFSIDTLYSDRAMDIRFTGPGLGPAPQHLMSVSQGSPEDDMFDEIGSPMAHGFSWSSGLEPMPPGTTKEFQVIIREGASTDYRQTQLDIYGEWIDTPYMDGTLPAKFIGYSAPEADEMLLAEAVNVRDAITGTSELTVTVIQTSSVPRLPYWAKPSEKGTTDWPYPTDLTGTSFQYSLEKDGLLLSTETLSMPTKTFYELEDGDYVAVVTEVSTGATMMLRLTVGKDPLTVTQDIYTVTTTGKTVTGTFTQPTSLTPARTDATTKGPCLCGIETAINYNAGNPSGDPCGVCWTCGDTDLLLYRGPLLVGQMVQDIGSPVTAASQGGTDGVISFAGALGAIPADVLPYMPVSWQFDLYTVSAQGEVPTGTPLETVPYGPSLGHVFSGLAPSWYCIEVTGLHATCVSRFWYNVAETTARDSCPFQMDVHVEPCYNMLTVLVTLTDPSILGQVAFFLNGNTTMTPVQVQPGDIFSVTVSYLDGCKASQSYQVTAADVNCPQLPEGPSGCMDPMAVNFDPSATVDSGRCIYGLVGCMDPTASNYAPNATIGGTCLYLCDDPIVSTWQITDGTAEITPVISLTNFSVTWTRFSDMFSETVDDDWTYYVGDDIWMATVTTSVGCTESVLISTGTIHVGCMDPLATNYQSAADVPYDYAWLGGVELSGPCTYNIPESPCVPTDLEKVLNALELCLSKKTALWYNRMVGGLKRPCEEKDLRTLALIRTVLRQHALRCVFNCQGTHTEATCAEQWQQGGPSGSSLIYTSSRADPTTYVRGDIVLYDGNYWTMLSESSELAPDDPYSGWALCSDTESFPTGDLLTPMLQTVRELCNDCMPAATTTTAVPREDTDTFDGEPLTDNGEPIILT